MSILPAELQVLCDYLNELPKLTLSQGSGDARQDSTTNEKEIIQYLQNQLGLPRIVGANIGKGNNRNWYDFGINIKGREHYVDIKVADLEQGRADNTNCIGGIYYVLTGKTPPGSNVGVIRKLKDNLQENDNDFYFLVVNKNYNPKNESRLKRAYPMSLRSLKSVKVNGNNLPFQCIWKDNIETVERTYDQSKDFLLSSYGLSVRKRADMYFEFERCFPDIKLD